MRLAGDGRLYRLIGPAFVFELMRGELWPQVKDSLDEFTWSEGLENVSEESDTVTSLRRPTL